MIIPVKTRNGQYNIYLDRGAIHRAGELLDLERRVLVVTDDGVPSQYAEAVAAKAKEAYIKTIEQGE